MAKIRKKKYTQTEIEHERQLRICACLWAYAYEVKSTTFVSDARFDAVCREIDPGVLTGNPVMDEWFKTVFNPDTGSWVLSHPDLAGIEALYERSKHLASM